MQAYQSTVYAAGVIIESRSFSAHFQCSYDAFPRSVFSKSLEGVGAGYEVRDSRRGNARISGVMRWGKGKAHSKLADQSRVLNQQNNNSRFEYRFPFWNYALIFEHLRISFGIFTAGSMQRRALKRAGINVQERLPRSFRDP